jgi:hypothetical protein
MHKAVAGQSLPTEAVEEITGTAAEAEARITEQAALVVLKTQAVAQQAYRESVARLWIILWGNCFWRSRGTGQGDNSSIMFPGTNGGGIIIIAANTINPNGFAIKSNGLDQTGITNDEGAGGGGGGGVLCLDAQSIVSPLTSLQMAAMAVSIDNDFKSCRLPGTRWRRR